MGAQTLLTNRLKAAPQDTLTSLGAPSDLIAFARTKPTLRAVWNYSPRGDWLEWLSCRLNLGALVHGAADAYDAVRTSNMTARQLAHKAETALQQASIAALHRVQRHAAYMAAQAYDKALADARRVVGGVTTELRNDLRLARDATTGCAGHVSELGEEGLWDEFADNIDAANAKLDRLDAKAQQTFADEVRNALPFTLIEKALLQI